MTSSSISAGASGAFGGDKEEDVVGSKSERASEKPVDHSGRAISACGPPWSSPAQQRRAPLTASRE